MGVTRLASLVSAALLVGAPALAQPVVDKHGSAGAVDWSRGVIIATGAAAADLRARSPEVARVGAERRARERARENLLALADEIAVAGGTTVGSAAAADPEIEERLDAAAGDIIDLEIDYGTDGSVVVQLGLPLESLRVALDGPAPPPPGGGELSGVVVRAAGVVDEPVLGLELVAGGESYAGPVVFSRPSAIPDRRLGEATLEASAESIDGRQLRVDIAPAELARARQAGALVQVVVDPSSRPD